VKWELAHSKQALKEAKKVRVAGVKSKVEELLASLVQDSFQNPPAFEKLVGDLAGAYSRRINIHNRLVYEVFTNERVVRVLRMWTHYE
jgi:Txe/YoeB family toxin of toxin-antitoxin system